MSLDSDFNDDNLLKYYCPSERNEKEWNFNIILANFEINYSRNTSFCHEFMLQEQWVP